MRRAAFLRASGRLHRPEESVVAIITAASHGPFVDAEPRRKLANRQRLMRALQAVRESPSFPNDRGPRSRLTGDAAGAIG
jgi:hypothetical protein